MHLYSLYKILPFLIGCCFKVSIYGLKSNSKIDFEPSKINLACVLGIRTRTPRIHNSLVSRTPEIFLLVNMF